MDEMKLTLAQYPSISWAYLFGSRARLTNHPSSDWDVAVWLSIDSPAERLDTCLEIQIDLEAVLCMQVDVVDLRSASLLLIHEVLRGRKLLIDRLYEERCLWEIWKIGEYYDWVPTQKLISDAIVKRLMKGGDTHSGCGSHQTTAWDVESIHP